MSEETKKVLEMLAEGKINAEQADKLLEKLTASPKAQTTASANDAKAAEGNAESRKYLRIVVDKPGHDPVNIRMPLSFANKGRRLLAVLPPRVSEKLAESGIDLAAIGSAGEDWVKTLEAAELNIEQGNKKVRIFCE